MSCSFDKEKLTGFFDGELNAEERGEVEKHISTCSECLRELGEIKSAAQLVRTLPRLKAPASVAQAVAREMAPVRRLDSLSRYRRSITWTLVAAASLLVVANVVYFAGSAQERAKDSPVAAGSARVPFPAEDERLRPSNASEDPTRGAPRRGADRKADEAPVPAPVEKQSLTEREKGEAAKGPAPEAAEARKRMELQEQQADQGRARALAEGAAPKAPTVGKSMPTARAEREAAEPLGKKDSALSAAPPPAPAASPDPAKPGARRDLEGLRQADKALPEKAADALERKAPAAGGLATFRFSVGSPQPEATRAKAEGVLVKLGVTPDPSSRKDAAALAAPHTLTVDLTLSQFEELKRQLEGDAGVRLVPLEGDDQANRLRAATAQAPLGGKLPPTGSVGGGAGAGKPDADGRFGAGPNDLKKAANGPSEEAQKSGNAEGKTKESKNAKGAEVAPSGAADRTKGPGEAPRRYVLVFQAPPDPKK